MDELEFNVIDDDVETKRPTESLFKAFGEARRKTEVNARQFVKESIQLVNKAMIDEIDQWISNGVVSIRD